MTHESIVNAGIKLRDYRQGNQKTLCPQCSHTRKKKTDLCLSVTINYDGAMWFCHNCGWTGGSKTSKPKFTPVAYARITPEQNVYDWFAKRGISKAVVDRNNIGHAKHYIPAKGKEADCIQFPYYRGEKVYNIKYRTVDKCFTQVKGGAKIYYGINDIDGHDIAIIVEGEVDKLSLEVVGYQNVISVPDGAPRSIKEGVSPEDDVKFSYIWECRAEMEGKHVIIAVDNDEPGFALAEELARRYGKDKCSLVKWSFKDANETLMAEGVEGLRLCIANAQPYPIEGIYSVGDLKKDAMEYYRNGAQKGLSTSWSSVDDFMTIKQGELSVVTGFPGSGKSEFVDAIMVNMAKHHGWKFAICSFENPNRLHLGKLVEKYLEKPIRAGAHHRISEEEYDRTLDKWADNHFYFINSETIENAPTIEWILEKAKITVARYGINGLVIDPYNEIERPAGISETDYVSQMLRKVKKFAQMYNVHVWFVAHPAKPQKDKEGKYTEPTLYDISGSANWVNKADLGVVVHRPDPTDQHAPVEIYIKKVRFKENGKIGKVSLRYHRDTGTYENNN